jgi:hypothetical protein
MWFRIDITRQSDDLHSEMWTFTYFDREHALVLDRYDAMERPSKRHKPRTIRYYDRMSHRSWSTSDAMDLAAVPIPKDVIEEVRQKFMDSLKVTRNLGTEDLTPR